MSTLDDITPATVAALAAGLCVLLPARVLDDVPDHRHGAVAALRDHLQAAGAGGPVSTVDLTSLGLVAANVPSLLADRTGDPDTAARFLRVASATRDPYSTAAR